MRLFILIFALGMPAQAGAQASLRLLEPAQPEPTISTEARLVLELGGAVLGTLIGFAATEYGMTAIHGEPMLTTRHGSLELEPFTMSGAYYAMLAPLFVSTAVSLVGDAVDYDGSYLGSLVGAAVGMLSALVLSVIAMIAVQDFSAGSDVLVVTGLALPMAGAIIGFEL